MAIVSLMVPTYSMDNGKICYFSWCTTGGRLVYR